MSTIEIKHLTFTYPGAAEPVLKDASVTIEEGDFVAIVGNNGCGKSTLCKTLNGLIPHFIRGDMEGQVLIGGEDTKEQEIGTLAKKAGYVYQDFENQIVCPTVLEDASYACLNYAMPDYLEKGERALNVCGLGAKIQDYVWQLSGGQKHLLALAGMAALSPDILILDEPIAQLDPAHADKIYEVLKELNETYNKTIIVIEHHTEYIARFCRHVILLKDGTVKWKLDAEEAMRRVDELQESDIFPPQVTIAARRMEKEGILPQGTTLPVSIGEGRELLAGYLKKDQKAEMPLSWNRKDGETLAEFRNVTVKYRSVKGEPPKVFDQFNLKINKGEKIALIGSNGAGKSTMLKLMMGLVHPEEGSVSIKGVPTRKMKKEELGKTISLVYQNPEEMFIKDSIRKDIEYAMKVRNVPEYGKRTDDLLEMFRLTELADRDGRLLSGGQMRRASLAIGVALNPEMLLLDEPTANLDIATRREILKTLRMLKGVTDTVIIATHDMQLVCDWAERIIVLYGGYVIADGSKEEIFSDMYVRGQVGIRPPQIFDMGRALGIKDPCFTIDEFIDYFRGERYA
ncbi:ABC transporter ATP-binding protein [Mediterraneibacter glycyrrhizinilyticus]|uniref:ABC transporter ATP-binding protein n=1 Tax=Mediterraneibacter glycyrrhizinilyticus TaxID=342942 RepID=UPI001960BA83|nr:ABC transporter ATP-binding protein [Mediterraneibacter glycyrrhizinilyticus]